MSGNRYTQIDFNQPISSYVPMPLDLMYKVGANKQARQDKAEEDRIDLLGKQWNRLSVDADKANKIKSEVNSTLDEFANKDFNDPTVKSQWYKKKRELADRFGPMGDIGAMEANYKAHQDYVKGLDEQRKKGPKEGGIDLDTYNKLRDISLKEYKGIGQDEGHGYNQFSGIQPAGFSDIPKEADELAKGWKENKVANEGWSEDPSGKLYKKSGNKTEWISEKEIYDNIKPQLMNNPMNHAFVHQDMLLNTYNMSPEEKANLDWDKTYNSYFDRAATYAANKYGFKSTEHTSDIKNTPWAKDKRDEEMGNLTTTTQSEGIATGVEHPTVKDMEFDSKGNLVIPTKANRTVIGTNAHNPSGQNAIYSQGKDIEKFAEQVKYIKDIQDQHPELKNLSPKATLEAIKKAQKSIETESVPLNSISNLAAKGIGEAIARNMEQRNFYLFDSKGKTTDGTKTTVLDELGISDKELQDQIKKNGISGYTQSGPTPGGLYVDVKDKNDKTRRVVISQDKEVQDIFKTSHAINEARKTLSPTVVSPFPGYQVAVKPHISKDGNVKWEYLEVINGKAQPTTLEEIRKQEKEALKESNYLGSQIQHTKDEEKDVE